MGIECKIVLLFVALPSAAAFAGPRPLLKIGAARTVDVRAQWGKPGKPESDMEYRKRMSGTAAPKKTAAARTAKIRKPAAAAVVQPVEVEARLAVHGVRRVGVLLRAG